MLGFSLSFYFNPVKVICLIKKMREKGDKTLFPSKRECFLATIGFKPKLSNGGAAPACPQAGAEIPKVTASPKFYSDCQISLQIFGETQPEQILEVFVRAFAMHNGIIPKLL